MLLKIPGAQDLLEALLSYTQRHFVRMDRLVRSTFLLDYTLASMNVLMPNVGSDSAGLPGFEQLEQPGTDVDASTGTDVDADAFMQPAAIAQSDDDDDDDAQAGLVERQEPQAAGESLSWQEDVGKGEEEGQKAQELQQPVPPKAKGSKGVGSKRRKSAPQLVQQDSVAQQAGSQTAVKVKRKKVT